MLETPAGAGPVGRMSSPPVPPPNVPTMSNYSPSQGGAGQMGAIPKLFYSAEQALDTIASAAPTVSDDIDSIKNSLRDILGKVLSKQNGASQGDQASPPNAMAEGPPGTGS